jgi:UDPglucose 6-dehydrogenase
LHGQLGHLKAKRNSAETARCLPLARDGLEGENAAAGRDSEGIRGLQRKGKNLATIAIIGTGYVGLANALLLAQYNTVKVFDISAEKIDLLNKRVSPIHDTEIELFLRNENLNFSAVKEKKLAYFNSDFVVIATPTDYDSEKNYFNTSSVESVIDDVEHYAPQATIIIKSTVPVGFTNRMRSVHKKLKILFSPEFLREGKALYDILYPSRIIVGDTTPEAKIFGSMLLEGAQNKAAKVLYMQPTEAEAVKLFSNTFLALRIAYFNELDTYAELQGLDTKSIIEGVCLDPRIGNHYNNPSFGYGGYCLPKDAKQLKANYQNTPNELISAIVESNTTRKEHICAMIIKRKPKVVGIYKLAMKSDSDNSRSSAVLDIIEMLHSHKIEVIIFDPSLQSAETFDCPVISDFQLFCEKSNVILANRLTDELTAAKGKVYTRDIFSRD